MAFGNKNGRSGGSQYAPPPQADASPDDAVPFDPSPPTVRECVVGELRNTLNSRVFYLVLGVALGLGFGFWMSHRNRH